MQNKVRTRIAPSPTGNLHVGTARTALFNYLFAKKNKGEFLLRIEDTDVSRSTKDFEKDIIDGLKWLGITWDDEAVQSDRASIYKRYINALKEKNLIYEEPAKEGEGVAYILKKPKGNITFTDLIREEVTFAEDQLTDLVVQKPDGTPTYNFAVAVDDHDMEISHVIRGEDHIANTPKQLMVYHALDWELPKFAHLPLILAPDRSKLSKRHGATSLSEFKSEGYLPEAMVNFMALLGWHPKDDKEIFTIEELFQVFHIEDVQKGGAVFDQAKLDWINEQYIKKMSLEEYRKRLDDYMGKSISETFARMTQQRASTLKEATDEMKWLATPQYEKKMLVWKELSLKDTKIKLDKAQDAIAEISDKDFLSADIIEKIIMPVADEEGRGAFLWPLRVALSGAEKSPSPFELAALLGKEEALKRLHTALKKLSE